MALGRCYLGLRGAHRPLRATAAVYPSPQSLLTLAACVIPLFLTTSSAYTNKNENMCSAVGGVCMARTDCGPQDAHVSSQLCQGLNLHCCIHKDNNDASENTERDTIIKKKSYLNNKKKGIFKKSTINRKPENIIEKLKNTEQKRIYKNNEKFRKKFPNNKGVGSASKQRKPSMFQSPRQKGVGSASKQRKPSMFQNPGKKACDGKEKNNCNNKFDGACQSRSTPCPADQVVIAKACKTPKSCKCCAGCKPKKNCDKRGGICKKKSEGCSPNYIRKSNLCLPKNCICCIPKKIPVPDECKLEDCKAENGICVEFSDKCPPEFSFSINYVLCQGSNCKCCLAPTITLTTKSPVNETTKRNPECPKPPGGITQTCPSCGVVKGANKPTRVTRVTGSKPVDFPNKYPWLVWLQHENTLRCGGAIITSQFVLTAAQCIYKVCKVLPALAINVIIADHNRNSKDDDVDATCTVKSEKLIPHPEYVPCTSKLHDNDIALIKLTAPLNLITDIVLRPICLPTSGTETYQGLIAVIAGWGLTSINSDEPDLPHETEIEIIGSSSCDRFWYWNVTIMLCAGGTTGPKDACTGDSGAPLITDLGSGKYTVVGIVSGGDAGCKGPGVYTRVNQYIEWIGITTGLSEICTVV